MSKIFEIAKNKSYYYFVNKKLNFKQIDLEEENHNLHD